MPPIKPSFVTMRETTSVFVWSVIGCRPFHGSAMARPGSWSAMTIHKRKAQCFGRKIFWASLVAARASVGQGSRDPNALVGERVITVIIWHRKWGQGVYNLWPGWWKARKISFHCRPIYRCFPCCFSDTFGIACCIDLGLFSYPRLHSDARLWDSVRLRQYWYHHYLRYDSLR